MQKKRLIDVDQAKGLAIFLVVLGHITLSSQPQNVDWYEFIRVAIYKFHMPFFMYLSGYVMYYTLPKLNSSAEYFKYIRKKAIRLIPPFLLFGFLIGIGKLALQNIMIVDGAPQFSIYEFLKVIIIPTESFASSVWYIYVLFLYYMMVPLFLKVFKDNEYLLLILGLAIYWFKPTNLFAINFFNEYLIFFVLGVVSVPNREKANLIYDKYVILLFIGFLISFLSMYVNIPWYLSKLIIGIASIPAIHSLIRTKCLINNSAISLFAKYTFIIYLMNTICIGLTKGIILKFISWDGTNFIIVGIILLLSGLYAPIVIKKYFLPKIPVLDRMTN